MAYFDDALPFWLARSSRSACSRGDSRTWSTSPYSLASSADMYLSRSVSRLTTSNGCPVCSDMISTSRFVSSSVSRATISMSGTLPRKPAEPWWIRIREFGSAKRLPCVPAASRTAPMLAVSPQA